MIAGEGEAAADEKEVAAAVAGCDPVSGCLVDRRGVDRRERRVVRQGKRTPARQKKAVSFREPLRHRIAIVFVGLLVLCGLPRPWRPLFEVDGFERVTRDRFFLVAKGRDPTRIETALRAAGACSVREC